MAETEYLWQYAPDLRQPAEWLRARSGVVLSVAAIAIAYAATRTATASSGAHILAGAVSGLSAATIWIVCRYRYLRSGRGCRLGIVYAMHRVPLADWKWTQRELDKCFASGDLRTHVSLRMLPDSWCKSPEQIQRLKSRYHFYSIITVVLSEPLNANARVPLLRAQFTASTKTTLSTEFVRRLTEHAAMIGQSHDRALKASVADALEHQAHGLFEIVLLLLGVWHGIDGDYQTAATALGALDVRLADRFKPDEVPRLAVRRMTAQSLVSGANFTTQSAPQGPALAEIISRCDLAVSRYGEQFPFLHRVQARNKYFRGDPLDEIAALSNHALTHETDQRVRFIAMLDMAVLSLLMARFQQSAKYFRDWLAAGDPASLNWVDLVDFADMANERYDHAIYVRALYRRFRGDRPFPREIEASVQLWIQEDRSRAALGQFYTEACRQRRNQRSPKSPSSPKKRRKRRRR